MSLSATGLGSGLDINSLVGQLVAAERQPVANRLNLQEARANTTLSALGKLKGAVSTFRDALGSLAGNDSFQSRRTTLSSPDLLSASVTTQAAPGSYQIEILALATNHRLASPAIADPAAELGNGILTLSIDGITSNIAIPEGGGSLVDIRNAINAAEDNPGVQATIINGSEGARLVLAARDSGAARELTITASGGDGGLDVLTWVPGGAGNGLTELQAPSDASLLIDGFPVNASGNTVSSAVEGITLNLAAAEPGKVVELRVELDTARARGSVQGFVDAWNRLVDTFTEVTRFNPESREGAALLGDAGIRNLRQGLRQELSVPVPGLPSLAEIGITTESNGKLAVDQERLNRAMDEDFATVGAIFSGEGGLAGRLESIAAGVLASDGRITVREQTLQARLKTIGEQRQALDLRMEQVRARLENQFNAMDRLLGQLRGTSDFLSRQLATLGTQS